MIEGVPPFVFFVWFVVRFFPSSPDTSNEESPNDWTGTAAEP